MPGKVNPVIPEAAAMVAAQVIGYDSTITVAGQAGNFQLNVMLPVIAYDLLEAIRLLANVLWRLPIAPSPDSPSIRNDSARRSSATPSSSRRSIRSSAMKRARRSPSRPMPKGARFARWRSSLTSLSAEELAKLLDPLELTRGGVKGGGGSGG